MAESRERVRRAQRARARSGNRAPTSRPCASRRAYERQPARHGAARAHTRGRAKSSRVEPTARHINPCPPVTCATRAAQIAGPREPRRCATSKLPRRRKHACGRSGGLARTASPRIFRRQRADRVSASTACAPSGTAAEVSGRGPSASATGRHGADIARARLAGRAPSPRCPLRLWPGGAASAEGVSAGRRPPSASALR